MAIRELARAQARVNKRAADFARYEAKQNKKLDDDANASISSFSSSSGDSSSEDKGWLSEQVEMLLEPYFMSFDNTWNRIQVRRGAGNSRSGSRGRCALSTAQRACCERSVALPGGQDASGALSRSPLVMRYRSPLDPRPPRLSHAPRHSPSHPPLALSRSPAAAGERPPVTGARCADAGGVRGGHGGPDQHHAGLAPQPAYPGQCPADPAKKGCCSTGAPGAATA